MSVNPSRYSLCVLAFAVVMTAWLYPKPPPLSDEANFVSTAFKMSDVHRLTAAVHHPRDILRQGMEHKHVKMPGYMVALMLWLKAFPDAATVRILNLGLFAGAILILHRFLTARPDTTNLESLACGVILFCTPLGLAYANTAMMESLVLLVVALHFVAWFGGSGEKTKLLFFYLTAFIAFVCKEVLALLSLSILVVHHRQFIALHRNVLRKSKTLFLAHLGIMLLLGSLGWMAYQNRGYYPSFRNHLKEAADISQQLQMIRSNFLTNLQSFGSFSRFPHDYLYGYALVLFALTGFLTFRSLRDRTFRLHLTLCVAWVLNLFSVCALYDNWDWRSHRIFGIYTLLSMVALLCWILRQTTSRWKRAVALMFLLITNLCLCITVNDRFINERGRNIQRPHVLTQLDLARPGDCLLGERSDYQFLVENPKCELIRPVRPGPFDSYRATMIAVIGKAQPRFVIWPVVEDLTPLGYELVGAVPRKSGRGKVRHIWMRRD